MANYIDFQHFILLLFFCNPCLAGSVLLKNGCLFDIISEIQVMSPSLEEACAQYFVFKKGYFSIFGRVNKKILYYDTKRFKSCERFCIINTYWTFYRIQLM